MFLSQRYFLTGSWEKFLKIMWFSLVNIRRITEGQRALTSILQSHSHSSQKFLFLDLRLQCFLAVLQAWWLPLRSKWINVHLANCLRKPADLWSKKSWATDNLSLDVSLYLTHYLKRMNHSFDWITELHDPRCGTEESTGQLHTHRVFEYCNW